MMKIPQETLAECLALLEQGASVEQIVSRYPDYGDGLRAFLDTAVELSRLAHAPTVAAQRRSRAMALQAVDAARVRRTPGAALGAALQRLLAPTVSFAILALIVVFVLPRVSAQALPGDGLYGPKRLVEAAQMALEPDAERRAALEVLFNEERVREVRALLGSGREAEAAFEGVIEAVEADGWIVAGIGVNVGEETVIEGEPWRGGRAEVHGRTQDGRLVAERLIVLDAPLPEPAPAVTLTATTSPTPTTTATPTMTASPTATATETASPTATETLQPAPPATAPPAPTWTPTPVVSGDDNGNDNGGDDNGNDNGGNDNGNDNGDDDDNGNDN